MLTFAKNVAVAAEKSQAVPHVTEQAIQRLCERRNSLLDVESKAGPLLDAQIAIGRVSLQYPKARILDRSVLRWRYETRFVRSAIFKVPLPKLALVNVSDPTFYLSRSENTQQTTSFMPTGLADSCYGDILKQLDRATAFLKKTTLSFTWQGLIPDEAVTIINDAEDFFGHYEIKQSYSRERKVPRVYLLVEAPHEQWTIKNEEKERVRYLDPLILGHLGSDLFVLGSFDPTPIEEYVALEFTTKALTA